MRILPLQHQPPLRAASAAGAACAPPPGPGGWEITGGLRRLAHIFKLTQITIWGR